MGEGWLDISSFQPVCVSAPVMKNKNGRVGETFAVLSKFHLLGDENSLNVNKQ